VNGHIDLARGFPEGLALAGEAAADEVQDVGWFGPDRLPPLAFTTHRRILQHWSREVLARGAA